MTVTYPRPLHLSRDGLALSVDDLWWRSHYPPNGIDPTANGVQG